jgi:hypothetical protein
MATSSITKNFVVSGKGQTKILLDAIDASAAAHRPRKPVDAIYLRRKAAADFIKGCKKSATSSQGDNN